MIRVCPERDAKCPHGMDCPYTFDRYKCRPGWDNRPGTTPVPAHAGDAEALIQRGFNQIQIALKYAADEKPSDAKLIPSVFELQIGHFKDLWIEAADRLAAANAIQEPVEQATHLVDWLRDGWTHCQHGTREWCEAYLKNAADVIASSPREQLAPDERACTCHPNDDPPRPCPRKFALSECRIAAWSASQVAPDVGELVARLNKELAEHDAFYNTDTSLKLIEVVMADWPKAAAALTSLSARADRLNDRLSFEAGRTNAFRLRAEAAEARIAKLTEHVEALISMMNEMGPHMTAQSGMTAMRAGKVMDAARAALHPEKASDPITGGTDADPS